MAEKLWDIIGSEKAPVSHRGKQDRFSLPEWMQNITDIWDEDHVIEAIKTAHDDSLLPALHKALQQAVIEWRASVRPQDTKDEPKPLDLETGEKMGKAYTMKALSKPKQEKTPEETLTESVERMKAEGKSKEHIKRTLGLD